MSEDNLKLWSCYPVDNNIENFESLQYDANGNFYEDEEGEGEGGYEEDGEEVYQDDEDSMEYFNNDCEGDNCLFHEEGDEEGEGGYIDDGEEVYQDEGDEEIETFYEDEDGEGGYEEDGEEVYQDDEDVESPGYENFTETANSDMELWTCYPSNKVENFENSSLDDLKTRLFGTGPNADLYMYIVIAIIVALAIYYFTSEKKN